MNKTTKLACLLLSITGLGFSSNLEFQHTNGTVVRFSPEGNVTFTGSLKEISTATAGSGELTILNDEVKKMWTTQQGNARNTNISGRLTTQYTTNEPTGLVFYNGSNLRAELHQNGDFLIAGHASQTKKATYYARGAGGEEIGAFDEFDQRIYYNDAAGRVVSLPSGGTEAEYYLKDHLGSIRTVVKEDATAPQGLGLVAAYDYAAYGEKIVRKEPAPVPDINAIFTGKEFDEEGADPAKGVNFGMNLYYFGARYYDADIGLWTSVDPKRQHFSPYIYGRNNPINRFDPDGGLDVALVVIGGFQAAGAIGEGAASFAAIGTHGNPIGLVGLMDAVYTGVHGLDNFSRGLVQDPGGPSSKVPSLLGAAIDAAGFSLFRAPAEMVSSAKTLSDGEFLPKLSVVGDLGESIRNMATKPSSSERMITSQSTATPSDATATVGDINKK